MPEAGPPPRVPADNPLFVRDDWPLVRKKVVAAAYRFVASLREATELVQFAIVFCLDDARSAYKWPQRSLVNYLIRVVARQAFNKRRHLENFPKVQALEDTPDADDDSAGPTRDPRPRRRTRLRPRPPEPLAAT